MLVPSTVVGLSSTDWVGSMKSKPLSQADYMSMYRDTGDKEYLAEMIVEYGLMPHSKIAEEVAAAILEHLPNSDWQNRHDFILLCYHMAKKENPDLRFDTGAAIVQSELEKLDVIFSIERIKKVLQRKYSEFARDTE